MSQILSSANQLYSEGKALMTTGKRDAALAKLTEARAKLQQLQLVYPLNQDAGQLTLRINQLIDPSAFMTFFGQKVLTIRANYRTDKQTSYSDLLDLYQINPSYPGIKKLLDEVEIYLGVRIPPPDPKALARSAELTKSAQKIYDANNRSLFQVALDQLDEAIKLNPDNNPALALKDRVQTAIGGKSVAVLSGDDEAKYQQAVQELQKGNKITASALVEQLLLNPKSRNSAKIQDLKKRIDSQL
jgi:tetratricopeptide (TPR) repeat protein